MFFVSQNRMELWDPLTGRKIYAEPLYRRFRAKDQKDVSTLAEYASPENTVIAFNQLVHDLDLMNMLVYLETDEEIEKDRKAREAKRI